MALTTVEKPNAASTSTEKQLRKSKSSKLNIDSARPPRVAVTPADPWPPPYHFEGDGLRRVRPYHYTYNTWCKSRWRDRSIMEIFESEFRDRPVEYYRNAILNGGVLLNREYITSPETPVRNGDLISHTLHRHEPPVNSFPIQIIHEDDHIIVINKPAGIPVHPAGRYNFNSIMEIMRSERGPAWTPMPCNRLDRLTSGIMFIGKHKKAAEDFAKKLEGHKVRKEYVARVVGEFPGESEVACEKPILQISPKLGLNQVRANGKYAKTVFRRLAYYPPTLPNDACGSENHTDSGTEPASKKASNPNLPWRRKHGYSIVRCFPLTGRTHQLRVHLQFLGHPISNDPIYSNQRVFGPSLGVGSMTSSEDESILSHLSKMGKEEVADAVAYHDEMVDQYQKTKAEKMTGEVCDICETPLYTDPGVHELGIYLHARKYADVDGQWSHETELPEWAMPPEGYEGPTAPSEDTDPLASEMAKLDLTKDLTEENERMKNGTETK